MKKVIFLTYFILMLVIAHAQTPNSFKYQAVVRDASGALLDNMKVGLRLSILQGSGTGASVYTMEIQESTNEYGMLSVDIGGIESIDWGASRYYLQVDIDVTGGTDYKFMGTSQILAVPYALYALNVKNADDADADPANELQTISKSGSVVTLSNSGGSFVDATDDADADPTNEIQDLQLDNNVLTITNNPNSNPINLSAYQGVNTDEQTLSTNIVGSTVELTIGGGTGGNTVSFQLPSDFVSRASGGTFSGPIYASNLLGVNTGDMSAQDIVDAYQDQYPYFLLPEDRTNLNRLSLAGVFTLSGTSPVQFTSSGSTNLSLPNSGTLATQEYVSQSINTSNSLATGSVWVGVGNVATPLIASGAGQVLIGNGSGLASLAITGDASLSSSGELILDPSGVSAGQYFQTTVNAKGLVTGGFNPTTLSGFGIQDGMSNQLLTGRIWIGEGGVATPLDVRGNGQILIGNGSTLAMQTIDGDVTIDNTGNALVSSIGGMAIDLAAAFTTTTDFIILNADNAGSNVTLPASGILANQTYVDSQIDNNFLLSDGFIFVGNASGNAVGVELQGDATITNDGTLTIQSIDGVTVSSTSVNNWNTAFGWGDHSTVGYVETELDPVFTASPANGITGDNITNWTTAFGWGDHSTVGYVETELDPVFTASPANVITGDNITNWTTAFGWGDHGAAGYLTATTGVSSIAGTTNEIEVSGSVGSVTISLPPTLANLTSVTATTFIGDLNGNATTASGVAAGNVTGNTLAANVTSSSLTEVGTITTGTWNAGNVTTTGTITGGTIVRSGGTSAQFLKADGSIDNNTYLTNVAGVSEEFTASAAQVNYTLGSVPSGDVVIYTNGIRMALSDYSVVGQEVTFTPSLGGGERIQVDYVTNTP